MPSGREARAPAVRRVQVDWTNGAEDTALVAAEYHGLDRIVDFLTCFWRVSNRSGS